MTGCSEYDRRGRSRTHIPGTYWLPRLTAPGFGGVCRTVGQEGKSMARVGEAEDSLNPLLPLLHHGKHPAPATRLCLYRL